MTDALLMRVLSNDRAAIEAFGGSETCVVVDWRDGPAEIINIVNSFLPAGYLRAERTGDTSYKFQVGSGTPQFFEPGPHARQEDVLDALNRAVAPVFELRQFTPVDGDGYALFLARASVWSDIERSHPTQTAKFFLSTNRLAAYWRKGYLARLFSRP